MRTQGEGSGKLSWRAWLIMGLMIAGSGVATGLTCDIYGYGDVDDDFSIEIDDDEFDINFKPIVSAEPAERGADAS